MKKVFYAFLIIILLIGIFVGIFTYFKNQKSSEDNSQEKVILTQKQIDELKDPFIEANVEFSCEILKNPGLSNEQMTALLNSIYKEKGFPILENETMFAVLRAYENNPKVNAIIKERVAKCE